MLLVGPGHTYAGMYPYPVAHPYDGYSMVDFDAPDVGQWPRFVAVWGQATILGPGDVVFIPRGWWAHIQAMPDQEEGQPAAPGQGEEVTWLEVELHRGARARVAEAVAPYVGRVVEELAVECEGVAGARGWLRSIGGGTERQVVDLATPQGYKRIRSATAIRDEVLLTIGDGANVAAFLEALTEGRMTPTPWLNAHYREPLYLKGAWHAGRSSSSNTPRLVGDSPSCTALQTSRWWWRTPARSGSSASPSCSPRSCSWRAMTWQARPCRC